VTSVSLRVWAATLALATLLWATGAACRAMDGPLGDRTPAAAPCPAGRCLARLPIVGPTMEAVAAVPLVWPERPSLVRWALARNIFHPPPPRGESVGVPSA